MTPDRDQVRQDAREPWFASPGDEVVVNHPGSSYDGMTAVIRQARWRRRGPHTGVRHWDARLVIGGRDVGWFTDNEIEAASTESANSQASSDG